MQQQQQFSSVLQSQAPQWKQDDEAAPDGFAASSFEDKAVRRNFIRRVYSILMVQLAITAGIISCFMFVESLKSYVRVNRWPMYASWGVSLVCIIVLACCQNVRRTFPQNFIFLGLFTVCEGVMLGTMASFYDVDAVLIAVGITAGVTLGLTLFAMQTKIDFTACGGVLFALLVILMIAGIIMIFVPNSK